MALTLSSKEFNLMKKFIEDQCGICLGEEKAYLIESRLSKILIESGLSSFEELYNRIYSKREPDMTEKIIDAITTNETLWFRDKIPWVILEEVLLPVYLKDLREGRAAKIRIWSAACSTGQEPYSIAMCIDNYLKRNGIDDISLSNFEIIATDISRGVLQVAKMGRYDSISIMRGLNDVYRSSYFSNEGRVWSINKKIIDSVKFIQFNLQNSFLLIGKFDLIFCRYVFIYFSDVFKTVVLKKMADTLNPQGALFVGSSEIITDYGSKFEMINSNGGFYYRLKG